MAFTKPSEFPEWASGGGATISSPSGPKRLLGWIIEKPPYQFFNWLFKTIYLWVAWLDQAYVNVLPVTTAGTTTLVQKSVHVMSDATLGAQSIQIPSVVSQDGMEVAVTKIDSGANTVTVLPPAGKKISGENSQVISDQFTTLVMVAYGGDLYLK